MDDDESNEMVDMLEDKQSCIADEDMIAELLCNCTGTSLDFIIIDIPF